MILLLTASLAAVTAEPPLSAGQASTLTVTGPDGQPDVGVTVRLVHRAGLPGEHEDKGGLTDAQGQVTVTPSDVGAVLVRSGTQSAVLQVGGAPPPTAWVGLLTLLAVGAAQLVPRRRA